MWRPARNLFIFGGFAMLVWLAGCFTEVGNAGDENLVTPQFKIDYTNNPTVLPKAAANSLDSDSIQILRFYLLVNEASYSVLDSVTGLSTEKYLWAEDSSSDPVDFSGTDPKAVLRTEKIGVQTPERLTMEFKVSSHPDLRPDSIDFENYFGMGYLKGTYGLGPTPKKFLFSLPSRKELNMQYSKAALMSWFKNNSYNCQFTFFASKWVSGVDLSKADSVRDMTGRAIVVLDTVHNPILYKTLLDSFYKSFNTLNISD